RTPRAGERRVLVGEADLLRHGWRLPLDAEQLLRRRLAGDLEDADADEPGLLEGADRRLVSDVRVGDARLRRRLREDDVAHEGADDPRPEPAPDELLLADEQIDARSPRLELDRPRIVVLDEVRLDQPE